MSAISVSNALCASFLPAGSSGGEDGLPFGGFRGFPGGLGSKRAVQCSLGVKTKRLKTTNNRLEIHRLDDKRYALSLDGLVRYVGTQEECERCAVLLSKKNDRAMQDTPMLGRSRLGTGKMGI